LSVYGQVISKQSAKHANFAIDSLQKIGYIPAAPQGVNGKRSLKKAISGQQSAGLRPSADWDWDWVTQGSPLGHAWVTQASN
jgi:hypothetical protein